MEANSNNSQQNVRRPTKKTKQPITPDVAAQLLQSAISYCNEAGLKVSGFNHGNAVRIQIEGLHYLDGSFVVTSQHGNGNPTKAGNDNEPK